MLRDDFFALKKALKLIRHVFTARIRAQDLDAGRKLNSRSVRNRLKTKKKTLALARRK